MNVRNVRNRPNRPNPDMPAVSEMSENTVGVRISDAHPDGRPDGIKSKRADRRTWMPTDPDELARTLSGLYTPAQVRRLVDLLEQSECLGESDQERQVRDRIRRAALGEPE